MKKLVLLIILFVGFISFSQKSKFVTYRVSQYETVSSIARKLGITPYDLIRLNPDAKDGIDIDEVLIIPNKNYKKEELPIVKTTNKAKDSIVDGYLYHTVRPLETLYSLSSKYDVSKRKVKKINNLGRKGSISVGQVLKFPTKLKNTIQNNTTPIVKVITNNEISQLDTNVGSFLYVVKPQDTFYTLTRVYNVTKEKLVALNPILKEGLKAGLEINIPKTNEEIRIVENPIIKDSLLFNKKPIYKTHIVQAKEGFFRLKQLYGCTKEDLIKLNPEIPELKEGLKLGMEIKIPLKEEEQVMLEGDIYGKSLNIVMMLPFDIKKETSFSDDSKESKKITNVTDYYLGALMALDSIKRKGLSVQVKVFDTKNSDYVINSILNSYNFDKTNLIIAPIKYNQFKSVSKKVEFLKIPVITPLSKKDISKLDVKNGIQNIPSKKILKNVMLDYISSKITNQNIVIIADEKKPIMSSKSFNADIIKATLEKNDSIKKVSIIRMKDGYIARELFDDTISLEEENWVILASNKDATTSIAVENLAVYNNLTLFSLSKPNNLDNKSDYKINNSKLNKLHFQYPVATFLDDEDGGLISFNNTFRNKYGNLPSEFSYKGFDSTYDALMRLANYNNIDEAFNAGKSKRLISLFDYKQNPNNSFTNYGVFIVRYNDFKLERVY